MHWHSWGGNLPSTCIMSSSNQRDWSLTLSGAPNSEAWRKSNLGNRQIILLCTTGNRLTGYVGKTQVRNKLMANSLAAHAGLHHNSGWPEVRYTKLGSKCWVRPGTF